MKTVFGIFQLYTWEEAVDARALMDVSEDARRLGIREPVFVTEAAWQRCVATGEGDGAATERTRLERLLRGLAATAAESTAGAARDRFLVRVEDAKGWFTTHMVNVGDSPEGTTLWLPEEFDLPPGL